jgi:protoporphyrinogen oxidase
MTARPTALVLGGGLSGMAAALELARAGLRVTLVERGPELGGLAGTFRKEGHFYPLAYHHILHRDETLLFFLDLLGLLSAVRWRKIRMLFRVDGRLLDLSHPVDFLRFPMAPADKLRFVRLMLRAFRKSAWDDWLERSAAELVDRWGGPGVRRAIFEPLCRLKFHLPASEVSGAWLGARLHFREGSAPLGYIPGENWTKVLCDGLTRELQRAGVEFLLESAVSGLHADDDRMNGAQLEDGRRLSADLFVSTLPTEVYTGLTPSDPSSDLAAIRYTAIVSAVCATRQRIEPDFYWMNLASPVCSASGLFMLNSLNPTIGAPGEACLNFVTHVPSRHDPFFHRGDDELWEGYRTDFRNVFGFELQPSWTRLIRLPTYSPVFLRGYRNPPLRSPTFANLYFAGNYRTFPSIASTGTALGSGLQVAQAILEERGLPSELRRSAAAFRLRSMPRA